MKQLNVWKVACSEVVIMTRLINLQLLRRKLSPSFLLVLWKAVMLIVDLKKVK